VNEYQPSSATLRLGGDSIYKQSGGQEQIRVGEPVSWLWIVPLVVAAGLVWYIWKK